MKLVLAATALTLVLLALLGYSKGGERALGYPTFPTPSPFHVAPAVFSGRACVDSDCIDVMGRPVVARIGDVECGQTTTAMPVADGQPASFYRVEVAPAEDVPGCGTDGAAIDFYIDGRKAGQTGIWTNGSENYLHIWVGADFASYSGSAVCDGKPCYSCFSPCPTALIRAYVGDELCGSMRPNGWLIGNYYGPLVVRSDEAQAGCGTDGATVTFKIDDREVGETAVWSPGFHQQNLTGGTLIWGDNDCSRMLDGGDALRILRRLIGGPPDPPACFEMGQRLSLKPSGVEVMWADIDCNGDITILDAHKTLLVSAGLPIEQGPGCLTPGAVVQGVPIAPG